MISSVAPTRSSTFYACLITKIGKRNLKFWLCIYKFYDCTYFYYHQVAGEKLISDRNFRFFVSDRLKQTDRALNAD